MGSSPDRLFALFIHYNLRRGEDWDFSPDHQIQLEAKAIQRLQDDVASLLPLLEKRRDGWHGFAFIFLDPGWQDLVRGMGGVQAMQFGSALLELQNELTALVRDRPVRLVSAYWLMNLLSYLEQDPDFQAMQHLLIGPQGQLRYDSVKVIEAVIRIANFGRNVPLLRFDDDVIFPRSPRKKERDSQIAAARRGVLELCKHFDRLAADPDVHYFVFSGSYLEPARGAAFEQAAAEGAQATGELLDAALNGFATRVVQLARIPGLDSVVGLVATDPDLETQLREILWIDPAAPGRNLELGVVHRFLSELWEIGAHPFRQVISGAGLCLSDSAILDLPPFSNMRENVMWIDDHLKFSLHHGLRHFGLPSQVEAVSRARPTSGRLDEAWFRQDRHPGGVSLGDVRWHTREYLPRLLRGAIADAWLREDPRLKQPASSFAPDVWIEILKSARGAFAQHFVNSLRAPGLDPAAVRKDLWEKARERLQRIVELWSHDAYEGTFLHLVTVGKRLPGGAKSPYFSTFDSWQKLGFLPDFFPDGLQQAVEALPPTLPSAPGGGSLAALVLGLIEDYLTYVQLVRLWRNVVQATRFLLNDRPDVFWPFPIAYRREKDP